MTKEQEIDQQLAVWQRETLFDGQLPENFTAVLGQALLFESAMALRMPTEDFEALSGAEVFTILDLNTGLFLIKRRTAHELGMTLTGYNAMQHEVEACAKEIRKMLAQQTETLRDEQRQQSSEIGKFNKKLKRNIPLGQA